MEAEMSRTIARWTAPLALAIAVGMIACSDDKPDTLADLLRWLADAGFESSVEWSWKDLAAIRSDLRS